MRKPIPHFSAALSFGDIARKDGPMRYTQNPTLDPLLTVHEAAAFLRWSPATLYTLANKRKISYVKAGRSLRFRRSTIEAMCVVHPALDAEVRP
jgi:excisionase family DNA binding protein